LRIGACADHDFRLMSPGTGPLFLRRPASAARRCAALLAAALLSGCASLIEAVVDAQLEKYFEDVPPPPALQHPLARLPFSEYWTGIVFNGEKIGFTRLSVGRGAGGRYEIRSEASFALRFLGIEKKVNLRAHDVVGEDLSLERFDYAYVIDGSEMKVAGRREGGALLATVVTGGQPVEQRLAVEGPLYPSSAIMLYPLLHGLAPGREYGFRVYSGELQAIADVTQRVLAYQKSRVFKGEAFKLQTSMRGQRVLTWIDGQGRPVFELSQGGVMIAALEDEDKAKRYVALAALNKKESLVDFSIVRPDRPVARPRAVSAMRVAIAGPGETPPSDGAQRCERTAQEIVCEIGRAGPVPAAAPPPARYLAPSVTVQSNDPSIRRTAESIVAGAGSDAERVARIVRWMDANVEKAPLDVFSALDVLEKRKAECQGHAYLYSALARAAGIPTRIANGLAYSEQLEGFLYHSWTESWVDGRWVAIDPTFGQAAADATHVKLLEGETLADLMPLLDLVGKLRIRVLSVEHDAR
jgi:hypothetical protein